MNECRKVTPFALDQVQPLDQGDNVARHFEWFLHFALSWAETIQVNWELTDDKPERDISLKGLPIRVQKFVELGVRFPFLNMNFYHEWVSEEYFVLGWRVGLQKVKGSWELWSHHYDNDAPTPFK